MALTPLDRDLLKRCVAHQPGAWNDFVDRFLGLIYHVIHHTAHLRSAPLKPEDTEDLAAEVLLQIVQGEYGVLRQFKGHSSLATYLTVVARRICVHELARRTAAHTEQPADRSATPEWVSDVAETQAAHPAAVSTKTPPPPGWLEDVRRTERHKVTPSAQKPPDWLEDVRQTAVGAVPPPPPPAKDGPP